ncbi:hypothetical protein JCM16303_004893 [Sporobolomyces ruberrimus]
MGAVGQHVSRFSFTRTDISQIDIEWLLENNITLSQVSSPADEADLSPPPSSLDGAFDHLPALSPSTNKSTLPYMSSSPAPNSPDTPRATRQTSIPRSQRSPVPLSLATYSFPPSDPSCPSPSLSRSSTPTPTTPSHPLVPKFILPDKHSKHKHSSTILVELDDFFPHQPSNTFTPFPAFSPVSSSATSSTSNLSIDQSQPPRKGSLAPSFFSTSTTSSNGSTSSSNNSLEDVVSIRSRNRSRTVSNKSDKSGGGSIKDGNETRVPKLAAYPRYVPPKLPKQQQVEGGGGKRSKLFGR